MGIKVRGMRESLLKASPQRVTSEIQKIMSDALEEGERSGKDNIGTAGTNRKWAATWTTEWPHEDTGRDRSSHSRSDSGDMQRDFSHAKPEVHGHTVRGKLGWDDNSPTYYSLQEKGFRHVLDQTSIKGMFALRDSGKLTEDEIRSKLKKMSDALFN